jgi:hypothetical protein
VWRIRDNQELRESYKNLAFVADIKWRTLEWFGHVIRADQTRVAKKIFESEPNCKRKVGGHSFIWMKDVENDL